MNAPQTPDTRPAINAQTPGPLRNDGFGNLTASCGTIAGAVHGPNRADRKPEQAANARLLAAGFNAFDRAARALNVDAAELAEKRAATVLDDCSPVEDSPAAEALRKALPPVFRAPGT